MERAYIVMENGRVFEGWRFGAPADAVGEMVFTTATGGYIETLTDPSYFGQIVVQTVPLIGNYGMNREDWESRGAFLRGYVAREICDTPSNFRCECTVDEQLKAWGIPGVCGVDTREITRAIREEGALNAAITSDPDAVDFAALRAYRIVDAVKSVSCGEIETYGPEAENASHLIALYDFGAKRGIIKELVKRNCRVVSFPCTMDAQALLDIHPDGIVLSNGPGDPAENDFAIAQVKKLLGRAPLLGVCLGHQILGLAAGAERVKMKFGHRGANQPVRHLASGRVYITSQNHGYAVVGDTLPQGVRLSMVNANDGSCEGLEIPALRAFSTQFHPEAHGGPCDTGFLFDEFLAMTGGERNAAR